MAFTIETGSGVPGANAYVSTTFAATYHSDRGHSAWTDFTTSEQQAAIIRASEYIDKRFGRRFRGVRQTRDQGLEWPRLSAFDDDGYLYSSLPSNLQKATAEYALRALICGVLAPDPISLVPKQDLTDSSGTRDANVVAGEVIRFREKVDVLEEEKWYESRSKTISDNLGAGARSIQSSLLNDFNIPEYPEADLLIEDLLRSSQSVRLVRGD